MCPGPLVVPLVNTSHLLFNYCFDLPPLSDSKSKRDLMKFQIIKSPVNLAEILSRGE